LAIGAFGERLRREREMRGITLAEISESTKIARRHLESLEKEDFDSLPGGIFNKGFVRAYARFLGIDEDQAVADYCAASAEPPPPEGQFPLEVHEPDRKLNPRRSSLPLVLALLALVVVLVILWVRNKNRPIESTENIVPPASAGTASPGESSAVAAANPSNPPDPSAAQSSPVVTPSPERTFLVVIRAKENSWVSLTADGKKWEGILQADQQRVVRAEKQIVLTTGNAGGLDVSYNGKALGAIGNESEVRTLTFTAAGLVQ
jgi:cytoskeleton protein RodZ